MILAEVGSKTVGPPYLITIFVGGEEQVRRNYWWHTGFKKVEESRYKAERQTFRKSRGLSYPYAKEDSSKRLFQ